MSIHSHLSPGDIVSVRFGGVLRHYGVVTHRGRVMANSMRHGGVIEQSLAEFAEGRAIKRHRSADGLEAAHVVSRARRARGARYDLTGSNCIDFVRHTHRQRPTPWLVGRATARTLADMLRPK